jgi:glycosyltransferase involved in cell wall biosynthesis
MVNECMISFVVPCYNEQDSIKQCLESIYDEMNKYIDQYEIIIVDNGSTDKTIQRVREFIITHSSQNYWPSFRVCHEPRKGIVYARTAGADAARGKWIANIDADNRLPAGWYFNAKLNMIKPDVVAFSGPLEFEDVNFAVTVANRVFYAVAQIFHIFWPTLQGGNYVIRKDVFKKMGGYDLSYKFYGEDTRTAVLAADHGKVRLDRNMWIHSSPRRLKGQGYFNTAWKYTINYLSVNILGKNVTPEYKDFR